MQHLQYCTGNLSKYAARVKGRHNHVLQQARLAWLAASPPSYDMASLLNTNVRRRSLTMDDSYFGRQTLSALAQLLASLRSDAVVVLLAKAAIVEPAYEGQSHLLSTLERAKPLDVHRLVTDMVLRRASARADAPTKHLFGDREGELLRCLSLDGWEVNGGALIRGQPSSTEIVELRDAFDERLQGSGLDANGDIAAALKASAEAFTRTPPDHNASTTHMRIAPETVARRSALVIAAGRRVAAPTDEWGSAIRCTTVHTTRDVGRRTQRSAGESTGSRT
ncbi:MAG: hypothetical protein IPK85_15720 [Gemmatimonadetes bacterium]|nr:hypothetical protein [Gemmatimonadota bacterium]